MVCRSSTKVPRCRSKGLARVYQPARPLQLATPGSQCFATPLHCYTPASSAVRSVRVKRFCLAVVLAAAVHLWAQPTPASSTNPKVRAITAFVRLDQGQYQQQIAETMVLLNKVKSEFSSAGYETETVRITTQPLVELVSGVPEQKA